MKMSKMTMSTLPVELLERIFLFTSADDLVRCSLVCRKWHELLIDEDSRIWKARFEQSGTRQFRYSPHLNDLSTYRAKVMAFECAWNDKDKSRNIFIKDNCLTLHRNPIAQSTDGIRGKMGFSHGQHYFIIIFHGPNFGSSALVGICTKEAPVQVQGYVPMLGDSKHGWAWDLSKNCLRHAGEEIKDTSESPVAVGQKIGMFLDADNGKLEFDVNGKYCDFGFTDLPTDRPLYPSVSAVYGNSEITMIYYGKPIVG